MINMHTTPEEETITNHQVIYDKFYYTPCTISMLVELQVCIDRN